MIAQHPAGRKSYPLWVAGTHAQDGGDVMSADKLMVFHAPFPLQPDRVAASMLRPLAMRRAFADLGYRVMDVTGYAAQRRRAMAERQSPQEPGSSSSTARTRPFPTR